MHLCSLAALSEQKSEGGGGEVLWMRIQSSCRRGENATSEHMAAIILCV